MARPAETEVKAIDLDRFHHFRGGQVSGVYDFRILEYLKAEKDIFILGGVPYIYCKGVFLRDQSGAELKTMIRDLIYPQFVKSPTIKRIYDLFVTDADLQADAEDLNDFPVTWINFRNGFYDPVNRVMVSHVP